MEFKEKAQIVAVSAAITLALAAGLYQLVKPGRRVGPADDAPIIMAGGSLFIGTSEGFSFEPDAALPRLNYSQPMQVFGVDISYFDASDDLQRDHTDVRSGTAGSVALSYCHNANCAGSVKQRETVTLNWDAANNIHLTSSLGVLRASRLSSTLRFHPRKHWFLRQVVVTGGVTPLDRNCGTDSECTVVIHNCTGGGGVTCIAKP